MSSYDELDDLQHDLDTVIDHNIELQQHITEIKYKLLDINFSSQFQNIEQYRKALLEILK